MESGRHVFFKTDCTRVPSDVKIALMPEWQLLGGDCRALHLATIPKQQCLRGAYAAIAKQRL